MPLDQASTSTQGSRPPQFGWALLGNLSVLTKLWLLAVPGLLATVALTAWHAAETYSAGYAAHEHATRSAVEAAMGVVEWAYAQQRSGAMSREQAQRFAQGALEHMRYAGNNYFWINDMHPIILMHPIKPALVGKDATGIKDPNGKAVFVATTDMVRERGSGFVPYLWPKPGSEDPVAKLSYVQGFKPWGWVIGSGIYIDDLDNALFDQLAHVAAWVGVLIIALTVFLRGVSRSLLGDLRGVTELAKRVSRGDLSRNVTTATRDEIGQLVTAVDQMVHTLRKLVSHVQHGSHTVEACAVEIASDNASLSQRTQHQAAALEETAATMEELTATIHQNANSTRTASELASAASEVAARSGAAVEKVVGTMNAIDASSRKISEIVGVVHDIALQTNILALNAEVEAARAGEHGRGFAAVATEVRNLAERSADAAKEIRTLIGASVAQVDQGNKLVETAAQGMHELVTSVSRLTALVAEISVATNEQSHGVSQAGQAIAEIDQANQQNTMFVEQTSAKAAALERQAQQLVSAVAVFHLGAQSTATARELRKPARLVRAAPGMMRKRPEARPRA